MFAFMDGFLTGATNPWTLGSSSPVLKNCYSPANLAGRASMVKAPHLAPPLLLTALAGSAPAKQEGEGAHRHSNLGNACTLHLQGKPPANSTGEAWLE